jgi:predicted ATPase
LDGRFDRSNGSLRHSDGEWPRLPFRYPVERHDASSDTKALPFVLRPKNLLIVLDCREHLVDAVASIAGDIVSAAPKLHVIATSREPLRANGETVRRLGPLATPLDGEPLTVAGAVEFPAIQLFVERATAAHQGFELNENNVKIVAEICRRLDGIALAIDWSYELLPERERVVLRRLSVFVGTFVLESTIAVVSDDNGSQTNIAADIGNLVAKSLVSAETSEHTVQYRLLDSMRA